MKNTASDSVIEFQAAPARQEEPSEDKTPFPSAARSLLPNVVLGRLVGFADGQPRVDFPGNPRLPGLQARTGVPLSPAKIGREVVLVFADNDPEKPIIVSLLLDTEANRAQPSPLDIQVDGERLLVTAQREIVLRCGEASITLTAAGKVLIKGAYVLSRSTGYNKIKGAVIDIN